MSIQHLAEHVRRQGRGEDTMLIHMTPKEVAGLQALAIHHGGSLTINPKTGLPEAGFLSKILPVLAGAALSFIPGVGPLAGAGLMTAGGTIATGSLSKGLMMGLGAFGGAGLAKGVASMGLGALANGAGTAGSVAAGAAEAATANAASSVMPSSTALSNMAQAGNAVRTSGSMAADVASQVGKSAVPQSLPNSFVGNMQAFGKGFPQAVQNPGQFVQATGGPMMTATYGATAAAPMMVNPNMKYKIPNQESEEDKLPEMPRMSRDFYARPIYSGAAVPIQYPYRTSFNAGGLTSLGSYSDGGRMVMGPGDGMSDHVPAMIGRHQPARLSVDEFVVPADVVSGIGNGSSKAGADKLYEMMDRVRQARTGSKKQAKKINSNRIMPA